MNRYFKGLAFALLLGTGIQTMTADEYWDRRVSLFDVLPVYQNDIVFLGNSLTDGGEFSELFEMQNVKNRGISSDVITGVEKRVGQVTGGRPAKIFLLIGINDVSHNLTVDELARRYERLVTKIREQSPETKLYVQSVMPINNSFKRYKGLFGKEKTVRDFNVRIQEIALRLGAEYIDLWPALADSKGNLKKEYTSDGLHLNGRGYRVWTEAISPEVKR